MQNTEKLDNLDRIWDLLPDASLLERVAQAIPANDHYLLYGLRAHLVDAIVDAGFAVTDNWVCELANTITDWAEAPKRFRPMVHQAALEFAVRVRDMIRSGSTLGRREAA